MTRASTAPIVVSQDMWIHGKPKTFLVLGCHCVRCTRAYNRAMKRRDLDLLISMRRMALLHETLPHS